MHIFFLSHIIISHVFRNYFTKTVKFKSLISYMSCTFIYLTANSSSPLSSLNL